MSECPWCKTQGRYGFDDDWCHDTLDAAMICPREGWTAERQILMDSLQADRERTPEEAAEAVRAIEALRAKLAGTS